MWFFVQLCSSWKDFNWLRAYRSPYVIAELLVEITVLMKKEDRGDTKLNSRSSSMQNGWKQLSGTIKIHFLNKPTAFSFKLKPACTDKQDEHSNGEGIILDSHLTADFRHYTKTPQLLIVNPITTHHSTLTTMIEIKQVLCVNRHDLVWNLLFFK